MIVRVYLPQPLRVLAGTGREVHLDVGGPVTQRAVLDALEASHPVLKGTIRDHVTKARRPLMRYYGCGKDLSLMGLDEPLPEPIASGAEPLWIIGSIAGG